MLAGADTDDATPPTPVTHRTATGVAAESAGRTPARVPSGGAGPMTTQATASVTIRATPEDVRPWVADIARHTEWSPKPYTVELVSGAPNGVGSRYRSVGWAPPNNANHVNDVEITDVRPLTRFALAETDASGTYLNTFDLTPVKDGTEVTYESCSVTWGESQRFCCRSFSRSLPCQVSGSGCGSSSRRLSQPSSATLRAAAIGRGSRVPRTPSGSRRPGRNVEAGLARERSGDSRARFEYAVSAP